MRRRIRSYKGENLKKEPFEEEEEKDEVEDKENITSIEGDILKEP